jgi:hypothetical protein
VAGGDHRADEVVVVLELVVEGDGPEAGLGVGVGAVEGHLEGHVTTVGVVG